MEAEGLTTKWQSFEEVAAFLLGWFSGEFGLHRVEGKQKIDGEDTEWEIDGKGVNDHDGSFMIVECKRFTTSKVKQEVVAGLAFRVLDTGAVGGILVTPLGFQAGAQKVASGNDIFTVVLDKNSTPQQFAISFLNKFIAGGSTPLVMFGGDRKQSPHQPSGQ
jgi:hypothetical protein